jgi:site-specific DNA-methyltransferase (adenine-specific)
MSHVEVKTLPLKDLKPNPNNPRLIKDGAYKKLVQSIKDLPKMAEVREIVVDKDMIIRGGNMRYKAMLEAGWTEAPVKILSGDWTEDEIKQFIIKDNVSGGEWDWDILANEWDAEALSDWGLDLPAGFGDGEVEEDEAPEVSSEPAISKLGEIYQCGRHRVGCMDSTVAENVALLMNGVKADMVFTDPPYGMDLDTDWSDAKSSLDFVRDKHTASAGNKYDKVIGDSEDYDPQHLFDTFPDCKEMFLWGADYYAERLIDKNKGSFIVWDKRLEDSADKMYGSCFELCWSKVRHKRDIARVKWAGIFGTEKEFDKKRVHPTQKPIALSTWFIEKFSKKDWWITDLFLGSGSTLIACEQTNRICYGCELDERYVDVIRKRYWKFTHDNNEDGWELGTPAVV